MKLTKAVEIMELNIKEAGPIMPEDCLTALKLLNEAAKRIIRQRSLTIPVIQPLLPGEDMP